MPQATTEDDAFSRLPAVIADAASRDRNEAETRHKIIDFILHALFAWPRNRVAVEENIHPGFADYILKKTNGDPLVFVEAKKEGLYFELPLPDNPDETSLYIGIKKLLTDSNIKAAANQVRPIAETQDVNMRASQTDTSGFSSRRSRRTSVGIR